MEEITYIHDTTKLIGTFYPIKDAPTLILFPAFEGPSEFCHKWALDLNAQGFSVFIADMYGNKQIGKTLEECFDLIDPFLKSRDLVRQRSQIAFETCVKLKGVNPHQIGAFGFCFGGMCSLELARSGAKVHASASIHGILKPSSLKTHPIFGKMLILHGFLDPQAPPSSFNDFVQEMNKIDYHMWQFMFFGNAKHSFTDPKTGTFDAKQEALMGREYNPMASMCSFDYLASFFKSAFK